MFGVGVFICLFIKCLCVCVLCLDIEVGCWPVLVVFSAADVLY